MASKNLIRRGLTCTYFNGKISRVALGVRLVVGQQTLDLYAVVRIHDTQPTSFLTPQMSWGVLFINLYNEGLPG